MRESESPAGEPAMCDEPSAAPNDDLDADVAELEPDYDLAADYLLGGLDEDARSAVLKRLALDDTFHWKMRVAFLLMMVGGIETGPPMPREVIERYAEIPAPPGHPYFDARTNVCTLALALA